MIPQTPWIERKFEFNFPEGLFPVILERLRGSVNHIEQMVEGFPDDVLSKKTNNEWSVKEQIGHLYDLEDLWYGRVEDFEAGEQKLRAADMTNAKTHAANHNSKPLKELLSLFAGKRKRLIEKAEPFDEAMALRSALHPRLQIPMRLVDHLFFIAEHDDHHLAKMRYILNPHISL